MEKNRFFLSVVGAGVALSLLLSACGEDFGPGNVQNLPPQAEGVEGVEENIEESGLEGQTGVDGQAAQEGETNEEQVASNQNQFTLATQDQLMPVTWLLGREVETLNDADLGTISDLFIDPTSGRVVMALLNHNGALNVPVAELPVPLGLLQLREQAELMLPIVEETDETWAAFPDLGADWMTTLTADQAAILSTFWVAVTEPVTEGLEIGAAEQMVRTSALLEGDITDAASSSLGAIQTMLIDLPTRQIKYVAVASSDTEAYGEGVVLLPFGALAMTGEGVMLTEDFDSSLIQPAPHYAVADFDAIELVAQDWDDELESYWDASGYSFAAPQAQQ